MTFGRFGAAVAAVPVVLFLPSAPLNDDGVLIDALRIHLHGVATLAVDAGLAPVDVAESLAHAQSRLEATGADVALWTLTTKDADTVVLHAVKRASPHAMLEVARLNDPPGPARARTLALKAGELVMLSLPVDTAPTAHTLSHSADTLHKVAAPGFVLRLEALALLAGPYAGGTGLAAVLARRFSQGVWEAGLESTFVDLFDGTVNDAQLHERRLSLAAVAHRSFYWRKWRFGGAAIAGAAAHQASVSTATQRGSEIDVSPFAAAQIDGGRALGRSWGCALVFRDEVFLRRWNYLVEGAAIRTTPRSNVSIGLQFWVMLP